MKRQKSYQIKVVIICGMVVLGALYLLRGPVIATALQWAVKAATQEHLSYDKRVCKGSSLTYTGIKLGDFVSAEKLEIHLAWKSPFYIESQVALSHPHITVDPKSKSSLFYPALLVPTKFFGMKWTIDEGSLDIAEGGPSLKFTLSSGETQEDLGRLVVYDQGIDIMHPLCAFAFGLVDNLVQAQIEMPPVSVERLQFLSTLIPAKWKSTRGDVSLQGQVLVDKKGDMHSLAASLHLQSFAIENAELEASVEGEEMQMAFDYSFNKEGSFWKDVYVDAALQGGNASLANLTLQDCKGALALKPGDAPYLELAGDLGYLEKRYPIEIKAAGGESGADLHFTLGLENGEKTEIGATLKQDKPSNYQFQCDLQHVGKEALGLVKEISLFYGVKEEVDFGSGWIYGKVGGSFESGELRHFQCDNVELIDGYLQLPSRHMQGFIEKAHFSGTFDKKDVWKIATFECDLTQGAISSQDWKGSDLNGNISIRNHAFQKSLLKGAFHGVPVTISFGGSVDAFEMTTEFVDDSKSWFELLMGEISEGLSSFPVAVRGITNKHEHGYSFNGSVAALSEEIQVGMELDPAGQLKQGWFFSHKFSDKLLTPFLAMKSTPALFGGELSFYGVFDANNMEAFIQGDNIFVETDALEIKLPQLGIKDPEFLTSEGWAHATYAFADKSSKVSFPFKEATITSQGLSLEHLKGNAEWSGSTILLTQLAGKCREIQIQADAECLISPAGDLDVEIKGKWVEGKVENLLSLLSVKMPVTGKFTSGASPFQISAKNLLTHPKVETHFEAFCQDLEVVLPHAHKLDKVNCGFVFDSKKNTSAITHLTGRLVTAQDKQYQLVSESLLYDRKTASYLFDAKLLQEGETFPVLNIQGEAYAKSPRRMTFLLTGSCYATLIDKVEFELQDGKDIVSFCAKSRLQGKDFVKQITLLENFGIATCDPSILDKISTLEGEVEGTLLFSPAVGFLLEAHGKNLKIEQQQIPNFELKGKKIADQWILEKMDIGGLELKGSLSKAQGKWFSPYWEAAWQGKKIKGEALFQEGIVSLHLTKVEGLLPPAYTLSSRGNSQIVFSPTFGIKDLSLIAYKNGKKIGAVTTDLLQYSRHKWESAKTDLIFDGSTLNGPFYLSGNTQDKTLRLRALHDPKETVLVSFSDKQIEGKWLGLNFHLQQEKTDNLFLGNVCITDGAQLAASFPKDLFFLKDIQGLELRGLWGNKEGSVTFSGEVFGKELTFKDHLLEDFHAKLDCTLDAISMRDAYLSDRAGTLSIKQLRLLKNKDTDKWHLNIPLVRGKDIRVSNLRTKGSRAPQEKPFNIRNLVFENIQGEVGNLISFTGHGSFNFTNAYKKEFSIFDTPLEMIKNFGFDPGLFTPVSGQVLCELKNGNLSLLDLKNTHSEGMRSQFYLASDLEPSYIDLEGNVCVNLRMKQDVVLKFGEPFALSIHGNIDNPRYKLR